MPRYYYSTTKLLARPAVGSKLKGGTVVVLVLVLTSRD
jgi:hypothetical protein